MTSRTVQWSETMSSLGDAVIAIGVFDGVHLGHQALLQATVAEAGVLGTISVAVTFDRDPDQVVAPETAAPQLLSLPDKVRFIAETGIDTVLVVPFTPEIAGMAPDVFLTNVLGIALRPLAMHVGCDFRFGARASGDIGVLERFGMANGFSVVGHDLVEQGGEPITSTRIRRLVASGDVAAAAELLGRPPRIVGVVHRGRGEGAKLGFPTANLVPEPYAALPADGVYAGRAVFPGDVMWAAAISVGTPPTFPDARDYLEAHLIDYDGDLYDQPLTLEFFERLRTQRAFASLAELTAAIADDVERALEIAGFDDDECVDGESEQGECDDSGCGGACGHGEVVTNPAALDAAERTVRGVNHSDVYENVDDEWVELLGPTVLSGLMDSAGLNGFRVSAPLESAGIPYLWQPYAPEEMPAFRPAFGAVDRPFTLFVPASYLGEAKDALASDGVVIETVDDEAVWAADPASYIEDPELLAIAEETARLQSADEDGAVDWDSWIPVLAEQPYDRRRLMGLQFALQAVGIPVKWDPFSPAKTELLNQGFFRRTAFTLAVPTERFDEAQSVIEEFEQRQA